MIPRVKEKGNQLKLVESNMFNQTQTSKGGGRIFGPQFDPRVFYTIDKKREQKAHLGMRYVSQRKTLAIIHSCSTLSTSPSLQPGENY